MLKAPHTHTYCHYHILGLFLMAVVSITVSEVVTSFSTLTTLSEN